MLTTFNLIMLMLKEMLKMDLLSGYLLRACLMPLPRVGFLQGRECFACAPTGSGKTLAFLLPILMKMKSGSKRAVKAVILCPTRELAAQTTRYCKRFAKGRKFSIKPVTNDLSQDGNFKDMHCDILVSNPLRLDHAIRKKRP